MHVQYVPKDIYTCKVHAYSTILYELAHMQTVTLLILVGKYEARGEILLYIYSQR